MTQLNICSFNVRGINDDFKRRDIFEYLKKSKYNIHCIQDIHSNSKQEATYKRDWGGDMLIASGNNRSRGVAVMLNRNFEYDIIEVIRDPNGNYIAIKMKMLDTEICLINIYGPNDDNPDFYTKLIKIIEDMQTATIILCGDWNLVQDQKMDTKNYLRNNNVNARERVEALKQQFDLVDPWRINNPYKKQYTWFKSTPIKMSRLDFVLVSADIMSLAKKVDILPGYRSDHSIVTLKLQISDETTGKGFWKFNISLCDQTHIKLIKSRCMPITHSYKQMI
jgi:exonuclease III